jgi:hypothetical protein
VDFPCPSDELSVEIRRIGEDLRLRTSAPTGASPSEVVSIQTPDELGRLADTNNRSRHQTLLLRWAKQLDFWLLMEDEALVTR